MAKITRILKKVTNQHAPTNGFDSTTKEDILAGFKRYPPEGNWRKTEGLSLVMIVITKTWICNDKMFRQRTKCPWKMMLAMQKILLTVSSRVGSPPLSG